MYKINKFLLYNPENYIQYFIITYNGTVWKIICVCVCVCVYLTHLVVHVKLIPYK